VALPGLGAQDAPGVLDEPSFPSDWGGTPSSHRPSGESGKRPERLA
jgi:hypothetical protein